MAVNDPVTTGALLRALGGIIAVIVIITGVGWWFAGSMSDAPEEGDAAGRQGCSIAIVGIILLALMLAACGDAHPATPSDRIVYVDRPVAVQPIKASDIPPLPAQLGPRPADARDGEAVALAGRCDAIAFVIKAWPLLLVAAGLPPAAAPDFPECDKKGR
jgi:hypothetical protein